MSPVSQKLSELWQFSHVKVRQNLINSNFSNLDNLSGWVCGGLGVGVLDELKAISAQLGLGFGLSLATRNELYKLLSSEFSRKNLIL